jgi:hypothetical protein
MGFILTYIEAASTKETEKLPKGQFLLDTN